MEEKYAALRTYIGITNVLGWLVIAIAVIASLVILVSGVKGSGISALIMLVAGVVAGIGCMALGGFLTVIIDIEKNSRKQIELLAKLTTNTYSNSKNLENNLTSNQESAFNLEELKVNSEKEEMEAIENPAAATAKIFFAVIAVGIIFVMLMISFSK